MPWKIIDCEVELPDGEARFGQFANAFRIMPDSGSECFLDFCVYLAQENRAMVIARIRIHTSFLPSVRQRLTSAMRDLGQIDNLVIKDGMLSTPTGELILFNGGSEEEH
ncbi:hypothetical protein N9917_03140 [Deltaproteobacteria bacterium]|nr:hypothetical protein [Deltaproteobacteria bacterium]